MLFALALLALAGLVFIAALLFDGVRALLSRRRHEAATRPIELVVSKRREAADGLVCLTLTHAAGRRLPAFVAGQHVLLQTPAGHRGKMAQRAYSLAAWNPAPHQYELGIKREKHGAVSGWIWNKLKEGDRISLLPPRGDFVLMPQDKTAPADELVLIGGGIGITPMRAMLHAAIAGQRRIVLWHAARSAAELLYYDEFTQLAETAGNFSYRPLVSRPDASWSGACGRLDAAGVTAILQTPAQARFYLCANTALMDDLRTGLVAAGIDPTRIHWEAFGAVAVGGSGGQRITLDLSGKHSEIVAAGEPTLLATLEAHDCAPPSECRTGSCGQCRTRLAAGEVRWLLPPGLPLPAEEILPCVCVPVGDVSLGSAI